MKIDNSQIPGPRFMFAIAFFLQSSALLTSFISGVTEQESWMTIVFAIVLSVPLLYLYRTLMVMFPDKNFLEIMDAVYGRILGKILGIGYAWFFITLSALNMHDLGDFAKITVMTETPHLVLAMLCILVAVYAVRHGLRVVTQYGTLFTYIEFGIVAITFILLLNQLDIHHLLPIFNLPAIKYVQSTHLILTIPFGELVVFLMLTPCVKMNPKQATKYWFWGVMMGMLTLLAVNVRDIAILGKTFDMFTLPGLVTLRLVSLGQALSRMEILFAVALIMLLFFKITVLCYVSTITVAQLFNTTAYRHLALIMGLLIIFYGPTLYPDPVAHTLSAWEVIPFIWTIFEFLIPFLTFILAKIRKLPQKRQAAAGSQEV
ncbi:Spore germination protein YndE [bioreactor metagenome]|uniref:Spore germination protein YndE n=1 Tax=bioreactor metagenome TaxID=1076179 RepID=A0A645BI50_9ZZZZ|nr:endospore germination permease [Candidatus Pelethousia sp.]